MIHEFRKIGHRGPKLLYSFYHEASCRRHVICSMLYVLQSRLCPADERSSNEGINSVERYQIPVI